MPPPSINDPAYCWRNHAVHGGTPEPHESIGVYPPVPAGGYSRAGFELEVAAETGCAAGLPFSIGGILRLLKEWQYTGNTS